MMGKTVEKIKAVEIHDKVFEEISLCAKTEPSSEAIT